MHSIAASDAWVHSEGSGHSYTVDPADMEGMCQESMMVVVRTVQEQGRGSYYFLHSHVLLFHT